MNPMLLPESTADAALPAITFSLDDDRPQPRRHQGLRVARAALLLSRRQLLEERLGLLDRDARVGDALSVRGSPARHVVLPPFDQMALDHRAKHLPRPLCDLVGDRLGGDPLAGVILLAVAVRAV